MVDAEKNEATTSSSTTTSINIIIAARARRTIPAGATVYLRVSVI
jgi:hypothetical protein